MSEFANQKIGTAVSILVSDPGRIQERLRVAYENALSVVPRKDIPQKLLGAYDDIMLRFAWMRDDVAEPSDGEASILASNIEELCALIDDELRSDG